MGVTRDDVARAAGVSTAVVSYVLNDGPRPVSAAARARVEAAIEDLGYRRDGIARFLRVGSTQSVGLVVPDIGMPFSGEFTRTLMAVGAQQGRQILLAVSGWDIGRERAVIESLVERRVDGIVLLSADPELAPDVAAAAGVPVAIVDRPQAAVLATFAAAEHLAGHGHTALGLLVGPAQYRVSKRRRATWADALGRLGLDLREDWILSAEHTSAGGYEATGRLLELPDRPTAVLAVSDAQAFGVLRAAHERGVRVPEDLAVISTEGSEQAAFSVPAITAVVKPVDRIAADAFGHSITPAGGVRVFGHSEVELVVRESCGAHPRPAH